MFKVPRCQNYKWPLNLVWHRLLYSYHCGSSGRQRVNNWVAVPVRVTSRLLLYVQPCWVLSFWRHPLAVVTIHPSLLYHNNGVMATQEMCRFWTFRSAVSPLFCYSGWLWMVSWMSVLCVWQDTQNATADSSQARLREKARLVRVWYNIDRRFSRWLSSSVDL